MFKLDRLGRSLAHLALILDELQRHGVALISTSQGIDTSANNPVGRLQLGVAPAYTLRVTARQLLSSLRYGCMGPK
jgi:DNA invertase Pin-like site-specific DNA recombinase